MSLAAVLSIAMVVPSLAATKSEVKNTINQLENQQAELESELASLKKNKQDTEEYIQELDEKIDLYLGKLEDVAGKINDTEAEIKVTQENLDEAKQNEKIQYAALKARIKAMYEAGNTDYITLILGSSDLKSLLNESEYISKINIYDDNLLDGLTQVRKKIAKYEKKLEEEKETLEEQQAEYQSEMESLTAIVSDKEDELVRLGKNIDHVKSSITDTAEQIEEENQILAEIIEAERKAAEEAARKKAEEEARKKAEEEARKKAEEEEKRRQEAAQQQAQQQQQSQPSYESSAPSVSTGMIWPTSGRHITSYFGYRSSPTAGASSYHQGLDIGADYGAAIWAAASGTVTTASYSNAMGNYIVISHGNGVATVYEHCSQLYVYAGQTVSQGETIAAVGSTGISTGAHLHFGVSVGGSYVNPLLYVSP